MNALSALVSLHHTLYSEGREEQAIGMCVQREVENALNAVWSYIRFGTARRYEEETSGLEESKERTEPEYAEEYEDDDLEGRESGP
jgi:hypothetical protein